MAKGNNFVDSGTKRRLICIDFMDSRGALRVRGAHQFGKRIVADISEIYIYMYILENTFAHSGWWSRAINIAGAICMPGNVTGPGWQDQLDGLDRQNNAMQISCNHMQSQPGVRRQQWGTGELYVLGRHVKGLLRGHWDVKCDPASSRRRWWWWSGSGSRSWTGLESWWSRSWHVICMPDTVMYLCEHKYSSAQSARVIKLEQKPQAVTRGASHNCIIGVTTLHSKKIWSISCYNQVFSVTKLCHALKILILRTKCSFQVPIFKTENSGL